MHETIGQRLKKARQHRRLTLEEAAEATHIRVNYLQALESDDYSIMPSAAQGRGFLRNYSAYLELNLDEILADFQKSIPEPSEISGPLPNADITRDQAAPVDETASRPFWTRWLGSRSKTESAPKVESSGPPPPRSESQPPIQQVESPVDQAEPPRPRGRKKKEETASEPARKGRRKKIREDSASIVEETLVQGVEEIELENEYPLIDRDQVGSNALSRHTVTVESVEAVSEGQHGVERPVVEAGQVEAANAAQTEEPKQSLLAKVSSLFKIRVDKNHAGLKEEIVAQPETNPLALPEPPVDVPVSNETAEEIFVSIGRELEKRRDLISLTHDEVERHIHVRAVFLKQMEEGAFDKLPSPVQTRGMLANYATFLDLDTDAILLRFAEALQARHRQKYPERLRSTSPIDVKPSMPPLRSFIAGDVIFGVSMVVILIALAIWGVGRVMTTQQSEQAALPTAPSISDVLAGTPVPTIPQEVTFVPVDDSPAAGAQEPTLEVPTLSANISVQVIVNAVERAFIRVSVDGETVYDGRVLPGDEFTFEAENQVSILTGNAAALRVIYNGQDLGLMGNFGEVVSQIYTGGGLATPTATIPPTATATPLVTDTPTVTTTPTTTVTPTPVSVAPTP